jgi:hypothetical protein
LGAQFREVFFEFIDGQCHCRERGQLWREPKPDIGQAAEFPGDRVNGFFQFVVTQLNFVPRFLPFFAEILGGNSGKGDVLIQFRKAFFGVFCALSIVFALDADSVSCVVDGHKNLCVDGDWGCLAAGGGFQRRRGLGEAVAGFRRRGCGRERTGDRRERRR